jgi:undecaprenyl-diphosphatase
MSMTATRDRVLDLAHDSASAAATAASRPHSRPRKWAPIGRSHRRVVRRVLLLVVLAAAVYVLLPQVAMAGAVAHAVGAFRWGWLPVVAAAAVVTYVMAALGLTAASGRPLPFGRTLGAQLAAAFTNRLAPAGVGAMATNVRYLEASGLRRARAMTAVALSSVAGLFVHVTATAAAVALAAATHQHFSVRAPDVPDQWPLLVLAALILAGVGVAVGATHFRGRIVPPMRAARAQATALVRQPVRAVALVSAAAGITAAYAFAFVGAVQGAGGGPGLVSVLAVYLGGSALAAAAPTPGGLGALEAGLVAGLTAVGQPAAPAVTAVLIFRVVTYWLPALPGAVAFWALRRSGAL